MERCVRLVAVTGLAMFCILALALVAFGQTDTDWGDAPDTVLAVMYPTLRTHNGANHTMVSGFRLGKTIDADSDGQPNATCTGDDLNNVDDEDGVDFTSLLVLGQTASVDVQVALPFGQLNAKLDAWVDFNDDHDWADSGERIFSGQRVVAGVNHLTFSVPSGAAPGTTARASA
jgi:hypothetical protein